MEILVLVQERQVLWYRHQTYESVKFVWSSIKTAENVDFINLLNPTGHVMHQQLNIQQLYVLPALYLCILYLSENKQRLVPLTA